MAKAAVRAQAWRASSKQRSAGGGSAAGEASRPSREASGSTVCSRQARYAEGAASQARPEAWRWRACLAEAAWRRQEAALIAHIVLFRPRADLSAADTNALIDAFERALENIPFIRRARVGTRITTGRDYERLMSVDYQYAAVLEFDDAAGLKAYLEHDAHEELGRRLFQSIEAALVYDFEIHDGAEGFAGVMRDGA